MTITIMFAGDSVEMQPSPINPGWIREGAPVARNRLLSQSRDGSACTLIWDCTAGVFDWRYDIDETVYILEGAVVVRDDNGLEHRLGSGDSALFPAGSHAVWRVDSYVRKVAFCRKPMPAQLLRLKRIAKKLLQFARREPAGAKAPAMFGGA